MNKPVPSSASGVPIVWRVVGGVAALIVGYLVLSWIIGTLITILKVAVVAAIIVGAVALFVRARN